MEDLNEASDIADASLSGRYLTSANQGPTGEVRVIYQPKNARPELLVRKSSMASGWFQLFALKGQDHHSECRARRASGL